MDKLKDWAVYHVDAIMYGVAFAGILGLMAISYKMGQLDC